MPRYVVRLQEKRWEREGREYVSFVLTFPKPLAEVMAVSKGDRFEVRLEPGRVCYRLLPRGRARARGILPLG